MRTRLIHQKYPKSTKGSHQKNGEKFHNSCELWGGQQILVCEPQKSAFFRANFPKNMLKLIHYLECTRMMRDTETKKRNRLCWACYHINCLYMTQMFIIHILHSSLYIYVFTNCAMLGIVTAFIISSCLK